MVVGPFGRLTRLGTVYTVRPADVKIRRASRGSPLTRSPRIGFQPTACGQDDLKSAARDRPDLPISVRYGPLREASHGCPVVAT